MTTKDFNEFAEEQLKQVKSILIDKTKEYNHEADRLEFFKKAADFQDISTGEALMGMATKHFISIAQMVRSNDVFTLDKYQEKCIDCINYCLLLLAIKKEELEDNK